MLKQKDFVYYEDRPIDIICMGRVAVDLYSEQIHTPLNETQGLKKYLGGCAGNIAVGTSRQGLKSAMFSCVGKDEMGTFLKNTLLAEGVDTTLLSETNRHLTALVLLGVSPPNHFPLIFYRENCADMQIQAGDCDPVFFKMAKALLITGTGLSTDNMRKATHRAIKVAKNVGTKVIIDLDYRPVLWKLADVGDGETRFLACNKVSHEYSIVLGDCDLIVGTEEEFVIASGCKDIADAISMFHKRTDAAIVLKKGENGCEVYLKNSAAAFISKPFKVDVFNILGAGDSFMSGLLGRLLKGESWQVATTYANACGALVVTRHGCAPAIPGYDEVSYFIKNYHADSVNMLINSKKLQLLHNRVYLGKPSEKLLALLAYDHRWQFEQLCDRYQQPYSKIIAFKKAVFDGFKTIYTADRQSDMGIIIDPEYGHDIIKEAAFMGINICTPAEASGTECLSWIDGISAYSSLVENSSAWTVKVLWKYHHNMVLALKTQQLKQLAELAYVCNKLERRMMLELIIPPQFQCDGESLSLAMADVYEHGIYPFWWKLQALKKANQWRQVDAVIDQYDPTVGVIILGGVEQAIDNYTHTFELARNSKYVNGFAVGRSIFWPSWLAYIAGEVDESVVAQKIAENYDQVLSIWRNI